jgi:ABC-type amino acid transport substrate-binding protein
VVSDIPEGLEKVAFGSADAYLGDLATASYYTEKLGLVNLKVSGEVKTPDQTLQHLAFGIRSDQPTLVSILNKTLHQYQKKKKR